MGWITGIAVYFVLWWTVLFVVLPWGTRPVANPDDQTGWRGVPAQPSMRKKVIANTIVTTIVWLIIYLLVSSETLSFRDGILALP
jgi:predicted secreted protein